MVKECVVIIVILVVAAIGFLRSKRPEWSKAVLPLMIVPLFNSVLPHKHLMNLQNGYIIRLTAYFVGLLVASLLIFLSSRNLPRGKYRYSYLTCAIGFTLILVIVLIFKGAKG